MHWINYKTRNLKGAYLYAPEAKDPVPLVIWLTGGNDGSQLPLKFSLGKLIDRGKLKPNCAVLIPASSYGHNYTTMTAEELTKLILLADEIANFNMNISICGWSLGADAASILSASNPDLFNRVCLISNYPKSWNGGVPIKDYRIIIGEKEKSASRDWGNYSVERISGYGHEIGEKIWTTEFSPLNWLMKGE